MICVELPGGTTELGDADGVDEVLEELPDITLASRAELLDWALTRTAGNRATANGIKSFIVREGLILASQRMTGLQQLD